MKLTVMSLVLVFSLFVVQPVFCEHEDVLAEEGIDPAQAQMLMELPEIDSYDAAMLLEKLEGNEDKINEFMESSGVPAPLKGFTSGRYNIHIGEETVGARRRGSGEIIEFRVGVRVGHVDARHRLRDGLEELA